MADEKLTIEIEIDDNSVKDGFDTVEKQSKRVGDRAERNLTRNFLRVGASIAAIGTALATALISRRAIAAAQIQEDAINQLNIALRNAGTFSEEASRSIQQFAASLEDTTTVGDEVILQQLALARNFTDTNEQAQELINAALDLSAAANISLDSAVRNLGKSFSGLTGELGESVREVRGLTAEQLKAGEAVRVVQARFEGAAAALRNTFSGSIAVLNNSVGTLLENLGSIITRSPALISVFKTLSGVASSAAKAVGGFGQSSDVLGPILLNLIEFARRVNTFVIQPIEVASRIVFQAFVVITEGITRAGTVIGSVIDRINGFLGEESEIGNNIRLLGESFKEQFEAPATDAVDNVLAKLEMGVEQSSKILARRPASTGVQEALEETTQSVAKNTQQISNLVQGGLVNSISVAFQTLGASLVRGQSAFEDFGKAILGIIGDLLINIGASIIATSTAVEALRTTLTSLFGGFGIAAGLALIALGGALKAAGGGGLGVAAGTPGGGAGGGVPTAGGLVDVAEAEIGEEGAEAGTAVTVNVEGTVLDPRGVGQQIAEILTETFDTNDIEVSGVA